MEGNWQLPFSKTHVTSLDFVLLEFRSSFLKGTCTQFSQYGKNSFLMGSPPNYRCLVSKNKATNFHVTESTLLKWCPGATTTWAHAPTVTLSCSQKQTWKAAVPFLPSPCHSSVHTEASWATEKSQRRNWFSTLGCYSKGLSTTLWELGGNVGQTQRNLRVQSFGVSTWLVLSYNLVPVYIKHPQYSHNLSCGSSLAGGPFHSQASKAEAWAPPRIRDEGNSEISTAHPLLGSCQLQSRNLEGEQSVSMYPPEGCF